MHQKHKRIRYFLIAFILISLIIGYFYFYKYTYLGYDYYESYYSKIVQQEGVKAAFDELKRLYKLDPDTISMCHQITHIIGRASAEKYKDVGGAFQEGNSFCWSGYYHGVMEGILSDYSLNNLKNKINTICSNIAGKESYTFDYYNCVHGLGHGIMYISNNELFDALKVCDYLDGWWEQNSCYGGVFMENIITDDKNHFTKYLKEDDVYYPCNAVEEKYKYSCYLMQTSHMLDLTDWDFSKVFGLCSQIDKPYIDTCYQSLGRDASGYTESDVVKTRKICLIGKDFRQQSNCVIGAVKDFIAYYHSDVEAKKLCEYLPTELKNVCFETLQNFVQIF